MFVGLSTAGTLSVLGMHKTVRIREARVSLALGVMIAVIHVAAFHAGL